MSTETLKAPRVLVVEDNPADVELLRYALDSAGVQCDLTIIDNGGDALALFQQRGPYVDTPVPDLAIVDLNLPRYDGGEILERARRRREACGGACRPRSFALGCGWRSRTS